MAHDKTTVRSIIDKVKAEGRTSLTAPEGKLVCDAYGIPVPQEGVATSAGEAARSASEMGFPVVLKIVSPEILHKTEAGGVLVGVKSAADVEQGYATIMANARKYDAKANLLGVQVQQMLDRRPGGDHRRGHRSVVRQARRVRPGRRARRGAEGHHVPAGARRRSDDALSMLDGIAAAEILKGVRGAEAVNREALAADHRERVAARRPISRRSPRST